MEDNSVILLNTRRSCYGIEQDIDSTITVGELINALSDYDEDMKIMFSNDGGYTYGYIDREDIFEFEIEKDNMEDDD